MVHNGVQRLRADNHILAGLFNCRQVRGGCHSGHLQPFKSEWKDNYRYWTELCLVLNHKVWQWHRRDDQKANPYNKLWFEAELMTAEWPEEQQEYYFRVTD